MNKVLITEDEKREILRLSERKNSLKELELVLIDENLKQRHRQDTEENFDKIEMWWGKIFNKYNIYYANETFYVDFETNCIFKQ